MYRQINIVKKKYIQRKKCIVNEIQWELTKKIFFLEICASYGSLMSVATEKELVHFLTALKVSKTQKELHHCLTTLKVFNTEKGTPSLSSDF